MSGEHFLFAEFPEFVSSFFFRCLSHAVFSQEFIEQKICESCHATSEPTLTNASIYRIYVTELLEFSSKESHTTTTKFEFLIKQAYKKISFKCPSSFV